MKNQAKFPPKTKTRKTTNANKKRRDYICIVSPGLFIIILGHLAIAPIKAVSDVKIRGIYLEVITVGLSQKSKEQLKQICKESAPTYSQFMRMFLEEHLEEKQSKI